MARLKLTDRKLKSLRATGERYEVLDTVEPAFGIRVSDKGSLTFILKTRFPNTPINPKTGYPNPTRRAIGEYPSMTLEEAREEARKWRDLIKRGIDPAIEAERRRQEELRKQSDTFAAIAEKFIARKLKLQRRGHVVERVIRNELMPHWAARPVADISHRVVRELIEGVVDRGAETYAHNVYDAANAVFNFAVAQDAIESNPCRQLRRKDLIGQKRLRKRILADDEIRAFWRATRHLPYPYGSALRILMITGQRHTDVTEVPRTEIDLRKKLWTIPPERFKSDMPQIVPLTDDVCAILERLPEFRKGPFLFSTTFGQKPTAISTKIKDRVDTLMLRSLKAMARLRGDDPKEVKLEPWVIHDMRRVVRSHLSALRVPDQIAEMVIGHGKKGLQRIYDQHKYVDEMRDAMMLWAARLRSIVEPAPANVVTLARTRA
jgi:hypothetical protein